MLLGRDIARMAKNITRKPKTDSSAASLALTVVLTVSLVSAAFIGAAHAQTTDRVGKAISEAFSFVPLDVGIETGIFKKHGLDVEKYDFSGSAKLQQGLAAGSIDMGLGSGPELAFIAKGAPSIGVAAMANAPWLLTLNVDKNSSIKTIADLKGKTVTVSTVGSLTEWLVHDLSRQQGWGPNGIKTLPVGNDAAQISALKTHQVDGVI